MNVIKKVSQAFWAAGLFTIPFTSFLLLWQSSSLGFFNPYTSFSLYISEILILIAFGLWIPHANFSKKVKGLTLIILGFAVLSSTLAKDTISASLTLIHIGTAVGTVLMIHGNLISLDKVKNILVTSIALQGLIALIQLTAQHSIGLESLGESTLDPDLPGLAKITALGHTFIRSYGTLPHANILAGFSLLGLFLIKSVPKRFRTISILLIGAGFIGAASKAAFLALLIALIITRLIPRKISIPIVVMLFLVIRFSTPYWIEQEFSSERVLFTEISTQVLFEHPEGIGLNQFTSRMQEFSDTKLQPWQSQPTHNIYLLIANEWGIAALAIMFMGLIKLLKFNRQRQTHYALITAFLIIGFFDHYLISLPQGILLSGLVIGISSYPKTEPTKLGLPRTKS
jgi:hypothetical protein